MAPPGLRTGRFQRAAWLRAPSVSVWETEALSNDAKMDEADVPVFASPAGSEVEEEEDCAPALDLGPASLGGAAKEDMTLSSSETPQALAT